MKRSEISRSTWKKKFGEAYNKKWKSLGKGHTQQDFADEINQIKTKKYGTQGTLDNRVVSKWMNGTIPEKENIDCICTVLGLPTDYFEPNDRELYGDSSKFITELGKRNVAFAKEIGLDLDLIKSLNGLIDFGKEFPLYTPICFNNPYVDYNTDTVEVKAGRDGEYWDHSNSAPMKRDEEIDLDLGFLQFFRDGKRITLHRADLAYLREVQDQIVDFVEYLFYKRSKELEEEVEKTKELVKETVKVSKLVDGGIGYSFKRINNKDILTSVDRFAEYGYKFVSDEGGQDNGKH